MTRLVKADLFRRSNVGWRFFFPDQVEQEKKDQQALYVLPTIIDH